MKSTAADISTKVSLTDISTWANGQDLWVFVVAMVGLIAGVIWAYFDE